MKKIFFIILLSCIMSPGFALDALDYEIAKNLYTAGEYKKALRATDKILKEGGMDAEISLLRYELYRKIGKLTEAKDSLLEALKYDETCFEAYIGLGVLALENANPKDAQLFFKEAIEISPELANEPDILYYYAKICILNGDFEGALDNMLCAIELNVEDPVYFLELGKIYIKRQDWLKAVNALEYAIGENKEINAECYNYIGLANYKRGNYAQALKNFKLAINIAPKNIIFLNNLALCYKSLQKDDMAQKIYDKMVLIEPDIPNEFLELSQFLYSENNFSEAKKTLENGIKRYPDNLLLKEALKKLNKS